MTIWVPFSWKHLDLVLLHPQNTNIKILRIHGFLMIFVTFNHKYVCGWSSRFLSRYQECHYVHIHWGYWNRKKPSMFDVSDETNFVRTLWSFTKTAPHHPSFFGSTRFLNQPKSSHLHPIWMWSMHEVAVQELLQTWQKLWRAHIYIKRLGGRHNRIYVGMYYVHHVLCILR